MGWLDGNADDWLKLLKAQYPEMAGMFASLEPSASDKKSALNTSLMSAGAAMLAANNGRQPASAAIGQGLLGGIQGYQQNISDQRKDALGRLQGLSGIVGLGSQLQSERERQDYANAMRGMQPQMVPQSDYAPGEAPGAITPPMRPMPTGNSSLGGPMGQPMSGGPPPLSFLQHFAQSPNKDISSRSMEQIKLFYPQFDLSSGQQRYGNDGRLIAQNVDPTKPVPQADGTYGFAPGAAESIARAEGLKSGANAAAQIIPSLMTEQGKSDIQQRATLGKVTIDNKEYTLPIDMIQQITRYGTTLPQARSASIALNDANASPVSPDAARMSNIVKGAQPGGQFGPQLGVDPVEQKRREAEALLPAEYDRKLQEQNLGLRQTVIEEAKTARQQTEMVNRFMTLNNDPNVASGRLAESISGLKNAANSFGIDIKGLPAEQAMQSISSQMALSIRNPSSGMGMPGALSDADRTFLQGMSPGLSQSKEGRALIAETYNALNARKLEVQRMMLRHEADGGRFDSGFLKRVTDYADSNPIFSEKDVKRYEKASQQPQQPEPRVTGKTRQYLNAIDEELARRGLR